MATLKPKITAETDKPSKAELKEQAIKASIEEKAAKEQGAAQERLRKLKDLFKTASESRRRYDWEWLARDLFIRGYQFSRYNPATKTVTLATRSSTRIPINLVAAHMRVIKNQVTAFRPKWEVMPNAYSNNSIEEAKLSGKLLDAVYVRERIREKIKEAVIDGLKTSVAVWQIVWDEEYYDRYDNKGDVKIWSLDPFDFYIDPYATSMQDAEFCFKAVRTSLDAIKKNPKYEVPDTLVGTSKLAESEYKQFLLQSLKMMGQFSTPDNEQQILKEGWVKERDEDGKVKMRVTHYLDSMDTPLYEKLVDEDDFPYRIYRADINPREVYGESWSKHVIPINRVINALESSKFDYNYRYAKGRIVIDKNSGVRVVTNEHGSIIEKNRGSEVSSLPLQPLPSTYDTQLDKMTRYFEDISGAHDASLGRLPTGVTSGVAIAELKQADSTNQDDLVDNLEHFLEDVGMKILTTMAKHYTTPRIVEAIGSDRPYEYFAVTGDKSRRTKNTVRVGNKDYPLIRLTQRNQVRVNIGSWLAFTKEARQKELKELYQIQAIDQKTLLQHLEFGDIDSIMERTRAEGLLKSKRGEPGNTETGVTEEELALSENEMMLEGDQAVQAQPQDNHPVHIPVHREALGGDHDDVINDHIRQHEALSTQSPTPQIPPSPAFPGNPPGVMPPEQLAAMATGNTPPDATGVGGMSTPSTEPVPMDANQGIPGMGGGNNAVY